MSERLDVLAAAPIERHPLRGFTAGAWARHHTVRVVDGAYVELAVQLGAALITTDARFAARVPSADVVRGP